MKTSNKTVIAKQMTGEWWSWQVWGGQKIQNEEKGLRGEVKEGQRWTEDKRKEYMRKAK